MGFDLHESYRAPKMVWQPITELQTLEDSYRFTDVEGYVWRRHADGSWILLEEPVERPRHSASPAPGGRLTVAALEHVKRALVENAHTRMVGVTAPGWDTVRHLPARPNPDPVKFREEYIGTFSGVNERVRQRIARDPLGRGMEFPGTFEPFEPEFDGVLIDELDIQEGTFRFNEAAPEPLPSLGNLAHRWPPLERHFHGQEFVAEIISEKAPLTPAEIIEIFERARDPLRPNTITHSEPDCGEIESVVIVGPDCEKIAREAVAKVVLQGGFDAPPGPRSRWLDYWACKRDHAYPCACPRQPWYVRLEAWLRR